MARYVFQPGSRIPSLWGQKVEDFIEDFRDSVPAFIADIRTKLGLGTMADQNSNAVNITGGSLTGVTISGVTNVTGPAGPAGPQGIPGNIGPIGPQGIQGPAGVNSSGLITPGPTVASSYIDDTPVFISNGTINDLAASTVLQKTKLVTLDIGSYELICKSAISGDDFLAVRDFSITPTGGSAMVPNPARAAIVHRANSAGVAVSPSIVKTAILTLSVVTAGQFNLNLFEAVNISSNPASDGGASLEVVGL